MEKKEEQICPDCMAHYTGYHKCPPWMKALVAAKRREKVITIVKDTNPLK